MHRLRSGNTLVTTGNGHGVIEVTPEKQVVWRLAQGDLDGIELAWTTSVQTVGDWEDGGHLVLVNCHAGPANPQVIAVGRDKRVLWTFRDFERFGNALTNAAVVE